MAGGNVDECRAGEEMQHGAAAPDGANAADGGAKAGLLQKVRNAFMGGSETNANSTAGDAEQSSGLTSEQEDRLKAIDKDLAAVKSDLVAKERDLRNAESAVTAAQKQQDQVCRGTCTAQRDLLLVIAPVCVYAQVHVPILGNQHAPALCERCC